MYRFLKVKCQRKVSVEKPKFAHTFFGSVCQSSGTVTSSDFFHGAAHMFLFTLTFFLNFIQIDHAGQYTQQLVASLAIKKGHSVYFTPW